MQNKCVFILTSYICICFRLYRKVNYVYFPHLQSNFSRTVYVGFHHVDGFSFVLYEIVGTWRRLVNKMSASTALHTQLAAVMECLVNAAVAELKKLMEGSSQLFLSLELQCSSPRQDPPLVNKVPVDSGEAMVRGWMSWGRFE